MTFPIIAALNFSVEVCLLMSEKKALQKIILETVGRCILCTFRKCQNIFLGKKQIFRQY